MFRWFPCGVMTMLEPMELARDCVISICAARPCRGQVGEMPGRTRAGVELFELPASRGSCNARLSLRKALGKPGGTALWGNRPAPGG